MELRWTGWEQSISRGALRPWPRPFLVCHLLAASRTMSVSLRNPRSDFVLRHVSLQEGLPQVPLPPPSPSQDS